MKKILTIALSVILVLSFASCGGNSSDKESASKPLDLSGEWTQTNSNSDTDYMEATISNDGTIEINWVFEEEDSISLYWAGTYVVPENVTEDEYSWTSENDTSKTDSALLASTSETKDFTYKDGVLSFEASAMGTTTTVEMEKK